MYCRRIDLIGGRASPRGDAHSGPIDRMLTTGAVVTRIIAIVTVALLTGLSPQAGGQSAAPFATLQAAAQSSARTAAAPLSSSLIDDKDSVKFGVLGDTGTGGSAQYAIAKLLADA